MDERNLILAAVSVHRTMPPSQKPTCAARRLTTAACLASHCSESKSDSNSERGGQNLDRRSGSRRGRLRREFVQFADIGLQSRQGTLDERAKGRVIRAVRDLLFQSGDKGFDLINFAAETVGEVLKICSCDHV